MHRSIEQVLRCYVTARQTNWDVLLPLCEFALNSTKSAATGLEWAKWLDNAHENRNRIVMKDGLVCR